MSKLVIPINTVFNLEKYCSLVSERKSFHSPLNSNILKQNHPEIVWIENEENLGFVKSINKGFAYTQNHFTLSRTRYASTPRTRPALPGLR